MLRCNHILVVVSRFININLSAHGYYSLEKTLDSLIVFYSQTCIFYCQFHQLHSSDI